MRLLARLVVPLATLLICLPLAAADLTVHFLDVGQGDAILIVSPERKVVLIDAGTRSGGQVVLDRLRAENLNAIDLMIASHPHLDHIGGLAAVVEAVPVRFYMDAGFPHPSSAYDALLELLEKKGVPWRQARAGRRIKLGGGASLRILAPAEPLLSGTRSDANANSVVARLELGDVSVLLTGDAEQPTEARLREQGSLRSTVLKVAHHGGQHSTTPGFLSKVKPEVAVISAGAGNSYGHPSPQTLRRLTTMKAAVYRTDLHGTVTFRTDGKTWTVTTERNAEPARAATGAP